MLSSVEIRTTGGALLTLPLEDVSDGLILEEVEGLDPVKATLVSSSFANIDGAQFHSSRRETRNLKLKIGLEPDWAVDTVRSLRQRLYDYLMPKSQVSLRFIDSGGLEVDITGIVESFETPLFSKEPQADISIICYDPDLVDLTEVLFEGETVSDGTQSLIEYAGTAETGFVFQLFVDRTLTDFTIFHSPPDGSIRFFEFSAALEVDDVLTISTVEGDLYVTVLRDFDVISLLYGKSPQSTWLQLQKGDNHIRVYATGDPVPYQITYTTRYGGL